jgi:hypothetical protein
MGAYVERNHPIPYWDEEDDMPETIPDTTTRDASVAGLRLYEDEFHPGILNWGERL